MEALSIFATLAAGLARDGAQIPRTPEGEGAFDQAMTSALAQQAAPESPESTGDDAQVDVDAGTASAKEPPVDPLYGSAMDDLQVNAAPGGWTFSLTGTDAPADGSGVTVDAADGVVEPVTAELSLTTGATNLKTTLASTTTGAAGLGGAIGEPGAAELAAPVPATHGDAASLAATTEATADDALFEAAGAHPGRRVGSISAGDLPATANVPDHAAPAAGAPGLERMPAPRLDAELAIDAPQQISTARTSTARTRVTGPDPDLDLSKLDPELLSRLQRVVDRMEAEFGHRVELVEGFRSQERQNLLFAQGRGEPGPVVTWTRESAHTTGRAVDVRIDGGWTDGQAFAQLQRIATEEGLVTLGMRDPGHLELPGGPATSLAPDMVRPFGRTTAEGTVLLTGRTFAPVAAPAGTAERPTPVIAPTAPVARVAPRPRRTGGGELLSSLEGAPHAGRDGGSAQGAGDAASTQGQSRGLSTAARTPLVDPLTGQVTADAGPRASAGQTSAQSSSRTSTQTAQPTSTSAAAPQQFAAAQAGTDDLQPSGRESRPGTPPTSANTSGVTVDAGFAAPGTAAGSPAAGAVGSAAPIEGPGPLGRLEQVMNIQDNAAANTSGVRVSMPDADGNGTRVQVGLRGRNVGARVDTTADQAAGLRTRVGELRAALEARGLDPAALHVRATAETPDLLAALRGSDPAADAMRILTGDLSSGNGARDGRPSSGQDNNSGSENLFDTPRHARDESREQNERTLGDLTDEFFPVEPAAVRLPETSE